MADNEDKKPMDKRLNNKFWLARAKHGRDKIFSSPQHLMESALEYFEWCDDNPLYADATSNFQGHVTHEPIAKMRAMTLDGLCLFLDIGTSTWHTYRTGADHKDFREVIGHIERAIKNQKFQGAAAGMLNANIIARDLGLKEHTDHSSEDGSMSPKGMSDEELERELKKYGLLPD